MIQIVLCFVTLLLFVTYFDIASSASKIIKTPKVSIIEKDLHKNDKTCINTNGLLLCNGGATMPVTKFELSLPALKLVLQIMLSLLNMACWGIPLLNKNFSQNTLLLSRANTFAGGIFLSLSFGHLIPHALEVAESVGLSKNKVFQYTLAGLLLVFFIEKIAFNSHEVLHDYGTVSTDSSHSHAAHSHDHSHEHGGHTAESKKDCDKCEVIPTTVSGKGTLSTKSAYLLLFAMALHSLFETMALGLASDKASSIFMAVSIALHQPADFVGPIGVSAGVLLQKSSSPFIQAVVVALTAGTFLYLGATEVMNEEFEGVGTAEKWIRFFCLLLGISMVYVVDVFSPEGSGGSGGSDTGHSHTH